MEIFADDKSSNTTQYEEEFLKYVQKDYCAEHRWLTFSNYSFPTAIAIGSGESSFD